MNPIPSLPGVVLRAENQSGTGYFGGGGAFTTGMLFSIFEVCTLPVLEHVEERKQK